MLVKPTIIIEDITNLEAEHLRDQIGIHGLILDLDNTLIAPHTGILESHIQDWLQYVNDAGIQTICVTNNKRIEYVDSVKEALDMPVIGHARKPFRANLLKAVEMLKLQPEQVAVVGDRPLTDILGGAWIGAHTILVDPLTKLSEPDYIKFLRKLERLVIRESRQV